MTSSPALLSRVIAWTSAGLALLRKRMHTARVPVTVGVSLIVFGLQAIHAILLSRLLGPTGRGEYGTAVFYAQTMIYIGLLGTHYSIARHATREEVSPTQLQRSAVRVGLVTGILSMLIAAGFCLLGLPSDKQYLLPLCLICTLLLPAEHLRITAQAVDHGRGKFNRYNLSRLFAAAVFPCLVLVLYLTQYSSLQLIAWFTVLVSIVAYVFYWVISDTKQVLGPARPHPMSLIRDGLPDGGLVLANDLYDRLAIFLVLWFTSLTDQGLFLTALPLSTMLLVAPNALELFAFRFAADPSKRLTVPSFFKYGSLVLLVQGVAVVGLQIALAPLLVFLFREEFIDAIPVARVLICAMALGGITIVAEGYLRGREMTRVALYGRVVAMLVMFAAVMWLSDGSPLIRVATAALLGYGASALMAAIFVLRDAVRRQRQFVADSQGASE